VAARYIYGMPIVSKLATMSLQDVDGREMRLGSLWERQSIVLAFIRHFG
jgi:hypothetical protein